MSKNDCCLLTLDAAAGVQVKEIWLGVWVGATRWGQLLLLARVKILVDR